MERGEGCSIPCNGVVCARAEALRRQLKSGHISRNKLGIWEGAIRSYKRRISDEGCEQPKQLRKAIDEVRQAVGLPQTGDLHLNNG